MIPDLLTLKEMVDNRVPTCGEKDCDVCDTRHMYLAKDFKELLDNILRQERIRTLEAIDNRGHLNAKGKAKLKEMKEEEAENENRI